MGELRVEKARGGATLALSNGTTVRGCLFLAPASAVHDGPERIKDVLNGETGFFPFEIDGNGNGNGGTALIHRDHVVYVTLHNDDEPRMDPGYEFAVTKNVSVLLTDGRRLNGRVRVYSPKGRDRLSDYARMLEVFRYLESSDATHIINSRHIVELRETDRS
jgi:hypothetical protein